MYSITKLQSNKICNTYGATVTSVFNNHHCACTSEDVWVFKNNPKRVLMAGLGPHQNTESKTYAKQPSGGNRCDSKHLSFISL